MKERTSDHPYTAAEWQEWLDGLPASQRDSEWALQDCINDFAKYSDSLRDEWNKWVRRNSTWVAEVVVIQKERDDEHNRAERAEALLREARRFATDVEAQTRCHCDEAYLSRGIHGPDCKDYMAAHSTTLLSRIEKVLHG